MSDLHARLACLPLWSGPIHIAPLPGGMTNRNLLVEAPDGRFVVRIAGMDTAHDIDRAAERAATSAAALAGLGPEMVWAEPEFMILRHVAGHTLGRTDFSNEKMLLQAIDLLRNTFKTLPLYYKGEAPDRRPLTILGHYAARLADHEGRWRRGIEHHRRFIAWLPPLLAPVPLGFAHNDVHGDNLVDDGSRLWLIDWEYAGQGQPLADIASLVNNARMTDEAAEAALRYWLGHPVMAADKTAFAAMRLATALRDLFWGYAQDVYSDGAQGGLSDYIAINEARVKTAVARL